MAGDKIGIVLSGGGIRALVFHLGVLRWFDQHGLWDRVAYLSTVSGGSLAVAAVFAATGGHWPKPSEFSGTVLPRLRALLTETSIQQRFVLAILVNPWLMASGRAGVLAEAITGLWNLKLSLQDLPNSPEWQINSTCYETGKNWRFSKAKMGDYAFGYTFHPDVQVADAVAASAGFPFLIGPLQLQTWRHRWFNKSFDETGWREVKPRSRKVTLWDGGVYENTGLESVFKKGLLQNSIDFLVVSDAGASVGFEPKRLSLKFPFYLPPTRLIDVATDQVRGLRAREVVRYFKETKQGIYVRIGRSSAFVQRESRVELPDLMDAIDEGTAEELSRMPTNLKSLADERFLKLVQHGYETARATYECYIGRPA